MSTVGNRFAYRERVRAFGEPVRPVEVTKKGPPRSNKARVRWLDGEYEGLEEWVPKIRLFAPWEQAEALLEDERRMLAAVEVSEDASDEATWEAAGEVFGALSEHSTPQEEIFFGYKAVEEQLLVIEDLDAAATRLDLDKETMLAEPHAFVDRSGCYKAPFQTAVNVAQDCCRRFPREILGRIQQDEGTSSARSWSLGTSTSASRGGSTAPRPSASTWTAGSRTPVAPCGSAPGSATSR